MKIISGISFWRWHVTSKLGVILENKISAWVTQWIIHEHKCHNSPPLPKAALLLSTFPSISESLTIQPIYSTHFCLGMTTFASLHSNLHHKFGSSNNSGDRELNLYESAVHSLHQIKLQEALSLFCIAFFKIAFFKKIWHLTFLFFSSIFITTFVHQY